MQTDIKYIVYKTAHVSSGKEYIGIHKQIGNEFDGYLGSGLLLKRAIQKYGNNEFTRETLFSFDTLEDARNKERELVNIEYLLREDTFNISVGGTGGDTLAGYDEETKLRVRSKQRESSDRSRARRREIYNGKCFSQEQLEQFRIRSIKRCAEHPHSIPDNRDRVHTDGVVSKRHPRNTNIPDGFVRGRTPNKRKSNNEEE